MANPVVANIIKSGAVLWYAPVSEAPPSTLEPVYGAVWGGNWARVGYTKAPLTVAYASTEAEITVEEELASVKRVRTAEALTLETVLGELTAAYLKLVGGDQRVVSSTAAAAGQKAFEMTGLGGIAAIKEYQWGFEGLFITATGDDEPIRLLVHKGTAMINGNLEFSQKTDDYSGIPLQIKALSNTDENAGEKLCVFYRFTAEAP